MTAVIFSTIESVAELSGSVDYRPYSNACRDPLSHECTDRGDSENVTLGGPRPEIKKRRSPAPRTGVQTGEMVNTSMGITASGGGGGTANVTESFLVSFQRVLQQPLSRR